MAAKARLELTGQKFGRLEVVGYAGLDARRNTRWHCVCECGERRTHVGSNLRRGNIVSCGCKRRGPRVETPAASHPDFNVFCAILTRCNNPNEPNYHRYGGRGIKVCDKWVNGGFWEFIADMGPRPTPQHSIDRIDVNGDYCPENCRWATDKEQGRNRRNNVRLTYKGETLSMSELAEKIGMNYKTFRSRIYKGWDVDRAVNTPAITDPVYQRSASEIMQLRAAGKTYREIADITGVSQSTGYRVVKRGK